MSVMPALLLVKHHPGGAYSVRHAVDASSVTPLTLKLHGKTTKTNPENKQSQISGSTQVTTVSHHTSTASKSSAITTAQYAN